jgi:hypothetical protein
MRAASIAFRVTLVAVAATLAALLAHVAIDILGDYVLAHDAYDGVDHQSRAIFVVATLVLALGIAARVVFELLSKGSGSHASLLRAVRANFGTPARFVLQTILLATVTLAGMELLDCVLSATPVDGIEDLFGGSLSLGLGTVLVTSALTGWLAHRLVRLLADRETQIAALIYRFVFASTALPVVAGMAHRAWPSATIERSLLLARRGSKRGPPLPIPG